MLLGSGTKPDPSSMAADVEALEKLSMDATGDIDEGSSWSQAGFESITTECRASDGLYRLHRFDRATLSDGEGIHATSYKCPQRALYWAPVKFHELGCFAASISHLVLVCGPASQILRVAICQCFRVSQKVGSYGTTYEAPCIWGQCKPTLEPNNIGNKWQFVPYPNCKPREAQDEQTSPVKMLMRLLLMPLTMIWMMIFLMS